MHSISEQKNLLLSTYPDAKEKLTEIEKTMSEKGLDWEEAYKLVKFDELNDPAYQARQRQ